MHGVHETCVTNFDSEAERKRKFGKYRRNLGTLFEDLRESGENMRNELTALGIGNSGLQRP